MEKKAKRVGLWLRKILGNQPIPQFEVTETSVNILHEIAACNEARDREILLLIENVKQRRAAYEAEAKYLQDILEESLGLSPSRLSHKASKCLDVLAKSAMILETKDTSLISFFSAINDMTAEVYATEAKNRKMKRELIRMRDKLTATLLLEQKLKEDIKKTEEQLEVASIKSEIRKCDLKFLKDKSLDMAIRIRIAEEKFLASDFDKSLTHDSLMELAEKVAKLNKETAALQKRLKAYEDLPPSIILAQVKIAEAKRELNILEEVFTAEINKAFSDMPRSYRYT
ncbi:HAUS augmin-like complex subunit 1 [Calypte anna]|uniref:HAUS augmin-like complex subunit 1 n=1 Tax=Calypte anna TaxID=9244 RepID=UPI0011C420ED|nr:HAUS augmin-like complex subunit 1 [Calypte anna]